jgi:hypothetical protein
MGRTKIECRAIQKLFAGLLGRQVIVAPSKPVVVLGSQPWVVGVYQDDDEGLAALALADVSLANYAGAALSLLPVNLAREATREGRVEAEMLDNFREILNVGASLFPEAGGAHVRIVDAIVEASAVNAVMTRLIRKPKSRVDALVDVEHYGKGRLSFVSAV